MQFSRDGSGWMKSRRERPLVDASSEAGALRELMSLADLDAEALPASLVSRASGCSGSEPGG